MLRFLAVIAVFFALLAGIAPASAQVVGNSFPDRMIGQDRAPIVIDEYISLTCPHCADFYLNTLPKLEKKYVDTGKVRIILHDYPLDGASLKAAALARCMPAEEFFSFIQVLYENQTKWALSANPDKILVQYARLGGLDADRAQACLSDPTLQSAVIAERSYASDQYGVQSTPTFIFNNGVEKMEGAAQIDAFATIIDRMLAQTHKH